MARITGTPIMPAAEPALLALFWIASPALPIGSFSYSEGLEAAVHAGLVHTEAHAADWLAAQLHLSLARFELPVIAAALAAWRANDLERIDELDAWVRRTRETSETRQQSEQMGRSLVEWLKTVQPEAAARVRQPVTYPVAWALAVVGSGATARDALLACAFGWAENMMQAAVKAVPLGQSAGQRILARLAGEIPAVVDHALGVDDDGRQAFAPMLAILSARHETQYSRLFRS
ncbi:urease accessory protein UreF [Ramlibacter lithotrophicus]|nr:urease accessory protein UreF [Ramlibacter lithotrophicus]